MTELPQKWFCAIGSRRSRSPRSATRSVLPVATSLLVILSAVYQRAGAQTVPPDSVSASLQLVRDTVYEHERFDMTLAIEIRDAQVGRGMELSGMPETRLLQFDQFKECPLQRITRSGRQVEIRTYKCGVRAMASGSVPMALALRVGIVRTQNSAFGTMRFESPVTVTVAPRNIRIVALPSPPADRTFSGAVGQFQFSAIASPTNLAPGELVRIVTHIVGAGWTDGILPPRLSPGGAFRVYEPKPVQVTPSDVPELQFEQTLVPQTTNATEIPVLSFTFFDPASGAYQTATSGPFRLQFGTRRAVIVDDTPSPALGLSGAEDRPPPRSPMTGGMSSTHWTLLIIACVYWLAVVIAMAALAARVQRGVIGALILLVTALVIFAAGSAAARQRLLVNPIAVVNRQEDARVSPGPESFVSFTIPKDASVLRIEEFGDWVKIEFAGNRGWIPTSVLSSSR